MLKSRMPFPASDYKMTATEEKASFRRGFGFIKPMSARSPLNYAYEGQMDFASKAEKRIVKGTPSTFKHRRTGSVYSRKK